VTQVVKWLLGKIIVYQVRKGGEECSKSACTWSIGMEGLGNSCCMWGFICVLGFLGVES
jgi:hypothetical protein